MQLATRRFAALHAQAAGRDDELANQLALIQGLLVLAGHSVERIGRLVGDLLDVSRGCDGHLSLHSGPCDLAAVISEVVEEQRRIAPGRTIQLHLPANPVAPLSADAYHIHQVATNYLTNALRDSPSDRPIEVQVRQRSGWVRISVRDEWSGIPSAERKRIWERFYRANGVRATADAPAGLGLGLDICRLIVEAHHGRFGLRSMLGRGSTFWFALPMVPQGA